MNQIPKPIRQVLADLPPLLMEQSGSVFYSGREAFAGSRPLYLLGLNPGGDPDLQREETIEADLERFWSRPAPWSAYADECWGTSNNPGTWGIQPRVRHLLDQLGLDPRQTPSSNVVFVRTRSEAGLKASRNDLLKTCWPVHDAVIKCLEIKVIVCFGATAGHWVRNQLGVVGALPGYRETNSRGWLSRAHATPSGQIVVTATHPSRADWSSPKSDPSKMIAELLGI